MIKIKNEQRDRKMRNNATLIAYELKTKLFFVATIFSLTVHKKTCTEIERNTKRAYGE